MSLLLVLQYYAVGIPSDDARACFIVLVFTESGSGDRDCITRMVFAGEDWGGGGFVDI